MMRRKVQGNHMFWLLIGVIAFVSLMTLVAYVTRDAAEMERIQRMIALSELEG
ncbi:MAG: hypothetical protein ABI651_02005 [Verrucomicrobiota bacterium]